MDKHLQNISIDWADKVFQDIYTAFHSPEHTLEGESLKMYRILKDWDWFELCPVDDEKSEKITRQWLAMNKYAKLDWAKKHPNAPGKPSDHRPSKWEIVTGQAKKKP